MSVDVGVTEGVLTSVIHAGDEKIAANEDLTGVPQRMLAEVFVDLQKWNGHEDAADTMKLLDRALSFLVAVHGRSGSGRLAGRSSASGSTEPPTAASLYEFIPDGKWTLYVGLKASASGDEVFLIVEVGQDLYGWLRRHRLHHLLSPPEKPREPTRVRVN